MGLFKPNVQKMLKKKDVPGLIQVLNDKDANVRKSGAEALRQVGDARAVEPLIIAMKDDDGGVASAAEHALRKIGNLAVEPLIATLKDKREAVRGTAAGALGGIKDIRAVEPLIALLNDEFLGVRMNAARALGELGDARSVEPLIAMLEGEHEGLPPLVYETLGFNLREYAAVALRKIGDARAAKPLEAALRDQHQYVRDAAANALTSLHPSNLPIRATEGATIYKIGILFDIDELGNGLYGYAAYQIFFGAVDTRQLAGCKLSDGDTNATLAGRARQYCIAVESLDASKIAAVKSALSRSSARGLLPLASRFVESTLVSQEPLVSAARINAAGELVGCQAGWVMGAWQKNQEKHRGSGSTVTPSSTTPMGEKKEEKPLEKTAFTNSIGIKFVLIPEGSFTMGSRLTEDELFKRFGGKDWYYREEKPSHSVKIKRPFYLQTAPVTQGQWQLLMGNTPSGFKDGGVDCPVEQVSWEDAQQFIEKLNEIEKIKVYRLPSEAEWEYACRAGSDAEFFFGDDIKRLDKFAWYSENSDKKTHPVGQKKPNAWGLYDMYGNVWEWVEDDWHDRYKEAPNDGRAWIDNPRYDFRVVRGGDWNTDVRLCRSAARFAFRLDMRYDTMGFRLFGSVALGRKS